MSNVLRFRGVVTALVVVGVVGSALLLAGCPAKKSSSLSPAQIKRGLAQGDSDTLTKLAKQGEKALPTLIQALGDPDRNAVSNAAMLIARLGARGVSAAQPLVAALARDLKNTNIQSAVQAIGAPAVPHLISAFRSGNAVTKRELAMIISRFGEDASPALNDMIALLQSPDEQTILNAISAIGAMGTAAKPAIPHLEAVASSHEGRVSQVARSNIRRIGLADKPGMRDMQDAGLIPR